MYWISSLWVQALVAGTGSTNQVELARDTVLNLPVPVPPDFIENDALKRIDSLFAEIGAGEAALAEARAGVETYRKSLLKAAVTGALTADWRRRHPPRESGADLLRRILAERRARWQADPRNARKTYVEPAGPDTTDLPDLPEGWVWASLQQAAFISGGVTVDKKRLPVDGVEVPYLRVANVQRGWFDLKDVKKITVERGRVPDLTLQRGDILLNEGGDRDKVGRGWVWDGQIEGCIHQNHVFKARPVSSFVDARVISAYMNEVGRQFFIDESKQTTNLASISLGKISKSPVPIAPLLESVEIHERLANMSIANFQEGMLSELDKAPNDLRQSILAAAFRGELVR